MKTDKKLIEEIAGIAKLKFTEEELNDLVDEINNVLEIFEDLDEIDAEEFEGTYHGVVNTESPLREDVPKQDKQKAKDLLNHASHTVDTLIEVPAMLEDGEGGA